MGLLLPFGVAAVSLLTIILVPLFVSRASATEQAILELETESYYTTEWELLKEYRTDAENRLDVKDAEIRSIRERLEALARERSELEGDGGTGGGTLEELIRLQRELEAELDDAYREREQLVWMLEDREKEIVERLTGDAETEEQAESIRRSLADIGRPFRTEQARSDRDADGPDSASPGTTEEGDVLAYDEGFAAGREEGSFETAQAVERLLDILIEIYTVGGTDSLSTEEVFERDLLENYRSDDAITRRFIQDIERDLEELASKVRRETEYAAGLAEPLKIRGVVTMVTLDRIYIEPLGGSSFREGQEVLVGRETDDGPPRILARVSILESEGERHEAEITRLFEGGGFPTESDKVYIRE
ncbi:MAG: hypothetical protein ACLFRY_08950 [Spirochaetia bacterium]